MSEASTIHDQVKEYYGKTVKDCNDFYLPACSTCPVGNTVTESVREALKSIHNDIAMRYYGCGLVIPAKVEGMKILDLGSGSGHDCFALSKLIGKDGFVTGIDMTDEQVAFAKKYTPYHMEKFGYSEPNVEFVQGYLEKLTEAGLKENYFDIIVSNCVICLVPDKGAVLKEAYKVLKTGGELYFSDMYTDTYLSESVRKNEVLWGEGISGALHWKDLHRLATETGFSKPYMVSVAPIEFNRDNFKEILGDARFVSVEYRLFKLPTESNERTSQVIYKGEIPGYEDKFVFDFKTAFKKGESITTDSDIISVLKESRYGSEFEFQPLSKELCCSDKPCSTDDKINQENPFRYLDEKGETVSGTCCNN